MRGNREQGIGNSRRGMMLILDAYLRQRDREAQG